MSNHLHAHVSTASADCDGPTYRDYVETFNDAEVKEFGQEVNDFSDIHFMQRVMMNLCSPYAVHQMTVKVDADGFEYNESTEEGYRSGSVRWCHSHDCDPDATVYRDVYAEMMNY